MIRVMCVTGVAFGLGLLATFNAGCDLQPGESVPEPLAPSALDQPAPSGTQAASLAELCDPGGSWRRRIYRNYTYETDDPQWAVSFAQREFERREGELGYVNAGDRFTASSLQGRIPSGASMAWLGELDVGRVVNVSNSDSPIQPEIDQGCERLGALERAEDLLIDALAGADRDAIGVLLELQRTELVNTRNRVRYLADEASRAQVNLTFNPPAR